MGRCIVTTADEADGQRRRERKNTDSSAGHEVIMSETEHFVCRHADTVVSPIDDKYRRLDR